MSRIVAVCQWNFTWISFIGRTHGLSSLMFSPLFHLHSFFHEPVSNSSSWLLVITWPTFFGYSSLLACELLFDSLGTTDFPWAFIAFKVISFPMNKTRCDSTQKSFRLVVSNHDRWFACNEIPVVGMGKPNLLRRIEFQDKRIRICYGRASTKKFTASWISIKLATTSRTRTPALQFCYGA